MESFNWTKYNLVRVARIAKGNTSCTALLDALDPETIDPVIEAFRNALDGNLDEDNDYFHTLSVGLKDHPVGSLGRCLQEHYCEWGFPKNGEKFEFPARYIFLHDAHHVLLGSGADYQGEMEVVAFEGALCGKTGEALMPILTQLWGFSDCPDYRPDFVKICKAWQFGAEVKGDLLETWEIERDLALPLDQVRNKYFVTPLT